MRSAITPVEWIRLRGFNYEAIAAELSTEVAIARLLELAPLLPPFANEANIRAVLADCASYDYEFKDPEWW